MTPKELYSKLLTRSLSAYAAKSYDLASAQQMAHAVTRECVAECAALGLLTPDDGAPIAQASSSGATPLAPVSNGNPGFAPVTEKQPEFRGGMLFVPPAGTTFEPPPPVQAGVLTHVQQAPTPVGHSALGTDGVILQPSQRPTGKDIVVNPAAQAFVPQMGGASSQVVPERIVR